VALIVVGVAFLLFRENVAGERLGRLLPDRSKSKAKPKLLEDEPGGLVARMTKPAHNIVAPKEGSTQKSVRLKLLQAGFRSEGAFHNFIGLKILFGILFPVVYLLATAFYKITPEVFLIALVLAFFGFFLPNMGLWCIIKGRQDAMVKALPDALDLMVVCVESGLGLDMTFKRVGDEIRPVCKDLSDEFYLANLEVRAGKSRSEAFKNMAIRTGVPELHNLMTILIQTARFGTSIAKALRVHADAMRIKRRQLAEEQAAKSTVKLIFPLVLFIFPAIFVVLIGPGAIRIIQALLPVIGG